MIADSITVAAMAKPATGEVRQVNGVWTARVTLTGRDRPSFAMPWAQTEVEAKARALQLSAAAKQLAKVAARDTSIALLDKLAAATTDSAVRVVSIAIEKVVGRIVRPIGESSAPTFRELGTQWTSGELAKKYPDHIELKRNAERDAQRLELYIYPVIGDLPVDRITRAHAHDVMARLPETRSPKTRRNIGGLMSRLLAIAVSPAGLIEATPIPPGFLPKKGQRKALASLYPDEVGRLLACTEISLAYRVLWGFLVNEGTRTGEACHDPKKPLSGLQWRDFDLKRGKVNLDRNKTDDPRAWALQTGTAEALRQVRSMRAHAEPGDLVFLRDDGSTFPLYGKGGLADHLRQHLKFIGLDKERPELFITNEQRHQMRAHDLRATFITVKLANGWTETQVMDRTGHKSSEMVNAYRRTARSFQELQVGDFEPLNTAIPELCDSDRGGVEVITHALPTNPENPNDVMARPEGFEPPTFGSEVRRSIQLS